MNANLASRSRVSRPRWRIWASLLVYLVVSLPRFGQEHKIPAASDPVYYGPACAKVVFEGSTKTLLQKAAYDAVMEFSTGECYKR